MNYITQKLVRFLSGSAEQRWFGGADGVAISERPAEVEDSAVAGHRQGARIYGKEKIKSAIAGLMERTKGSLTLLHLPQSRS